jgi:hypothetical protein
VLLRYPLLPDLPAPPAALSHPQGTFYSTTGLFSTEMTRQEGVALLGASALSLALVGEQLTGRKARQWFIASGAALGGSAALTFSDSERVGRRWVAAGWLLRGTSN